MSEANNQDPAQGEAIEEIASDQNQAGKQLQLQIDDAQTPVTYSSTVRVWGSAEEINLDFAGPIRPGGQSGVARMKIEQRITVNPWAAKRLAIALGQAVQRYEKTYGTLELDERKRRVGGGATPTPTAGKPS